MKRLALVFLFACNTTSTGTPPPPTPTPTPTPSASAAPAPPPMSCSKDGECSTLSSYCGDLPCACVPYLTSGGAPKCNQPNSVKCFVDPCQRKTAACQNGKCVITAGATQ